MRRTLRLEVEAMLAARADDEAFGKAVGNLQLGMAPGTAKPEHGHFLVAAEWFLS